jgi:4-amino-4-deoxy-L-arabinose transferase-like glycosyltransferase
MDNKSKLRNLIIISLLALGLLFFITRLINLTKLPIFTDEAIYIRWSQIGSRDANWRFISLVDGKQPLFTWIMMVYFKLIHGDPLMVGRLVSVTAGFVSLIGIMLLGKELFNSRRVALISGFLYIIIPFTLIYDRLALYDSLVSTFSIWSLYLGIRLVRTNRVDIAMTLGLILGTGMLNKSSGFLSLYFLPFTLILFDWKGKKIIQRLFRWVLLVILAAILSQFCYGILRLSPLFNMITAKNSVFLYSFQEWSSHPFNYLFGNITGLIDWLVGYLTIPISIIAFLPILVIFWRIREKILLYIWWLGPFVGLAMFGRVIYPRFILFMTIPLIIMAATTIAWITRIAGRKLIGIMIIFFILLPSLYTSYYIIKDPKYALIPQADSGQLINDWPSGWGVREVNQFLLEKSKLGKVTVFTDGTFGLLPYGIEIYLVDNPNITIKGIWPMPIKIPDEILNSARVAPTYIILNQLTTLPISWPIKFIASYDKGLNQSRKLQLLEVLPIATDSSLLNFKKI